MERYGLILGSAACLFEDLERFSMIRDPAREIVIAVNDAGHLYEGYLHHWVTLHEENMEKWMLQRGRHLNQDYTTWSQFHRRRRRGFPAFRTDERFHHWGSGSSGLGACAVAKDILGLKKNVLCGIPMDEQIKVTGERAWESPSDDIDIHRRGWIRDYHKLVGAFRSMSGWTNTLLGPPTESWLNERSDT